MITRFEISLSTPDPPVGYPPSLGDEIITTCHPGKEILWIVDSIEKDRFEARESDTEKNNALAFVRSSEGVWTTLFMYTRSKNITAPEIVRRILKGEVPDINGGFIPMIL